jgi:hypothetical protein
MTNAASDPKYLAFGYVGARSLRDELGDSFVEITVKLSRIRTPTKLVLWRSDGTGLAIWSEMHELAEMDEVGVLRFMPTTRVEEILEDGDRETIETFAANAFAGQHSLSKLVVEDSGYTLETGFVVTPEIGGDLFIVADAFPCHIAVIGLQDLISSSKAEYNLSRYKRVDW